MELMQTLRKIRACEGDAAAQLLLEAYVAQKVAAESERWARIVCDALDLYDRMETQAAMDMMAELVAAKRA
jgi:hypothetical protein